MGEARMRPEVLCEPMPAPQRIAPFATAVSADVTVDGVDICTGRLILLHDPAGNDAWDGTFRFVAYARAEIDLDMITDPALADVGWSWLTEALAAHGAVWAAASGTVTRVATDSFGAMADDSGNAQIEIRASWTPQEVGDVLLGDRPRRGLGRTTVYCGRPAAGPRGRDRHAQPPGTPWSRSLGHDPRRRPNLPRRGPSPCRPRDRGPTGRHLAGVRPRRRPPNRPHRPPRCSSCATGSRS